MDRSHRRRLAAPARLALSALALGLFASCTEVVPVPTAAEDTTLSSAADQPLDAGSSRIAEQPGPEVARTRKACVALADIEFGTIAYLDEVKALPPGAKPSGGAPCRSSADLNRQPGPENGYADDSCEFTGSDGVVYWIRENRIAWKNLPVTRRSASELPLGLRPTHDVGAAQRLLERRGLKPSRGEYYGETYLAVAFCEDLTAAPALLFDAQGRFQRLEIASAF